LRVSKRPLFVLFCTTPKEDERVARLTAYLTAYLAD
jgi:hypothetical protein